MTETGCDAAGREEVDLGPLPGYLGHLLRRAQGRAFADFAAELGDAISTREFALLNVVAANPGITQVRLAVALELDKSTVSPAVASLVRRGLLEREALADRRQQALRLAPGATERLAALRARVERHEARIAAGLTPEQRVELMRLLTIFIGRDPRPLRVDAGRGAP
jgi:DNA-binding MarR family transcriptional regulator